MAFRKHPSPAHNSLGVQVCQWMPVPPVQKQPPPRTSNITDHTCPRFDHILPRHIETPSTKPLFPCTHACDMIECMDRMDTVTGTVPERFSSVFSFTSKSWPKSTYYRHLNFRIATEKRDPDFLRDLVANGRTDQGLWSKLVSRFEG